MSVSRGRLPALRILKDNDTARGGKAATVKLRLVPVQEATPPLPRLRALRFGNRFPWWLPLPLLWRLPHLLPPRLLGADGVIASVDAESGTAWMGRLLRLLQRSPSATASASRFCGGYPLRFGICFCFGYWSASASAAADKNASVANDAKDQSGDSTSATEQVTGSAEALASRTALRWRLLVWLLSLQPPGLPQTVRY